VSCRASKFRLGFVRLKCDDDDDDDERIDSGTHRYDRFARSRQTFRHFRLDRSLSSKLFRTGPLLTSCAVAPPVMSHGNLLTHAYST